MTAVYDDAARALDDTRGLDDILDDNVAARAEALHASVGLPDVPVPADRMHRVLTVLATVGLFTGIFTTWNTVVQIPATGALSMLGFAACLTLTVAAATVKSEKALRRVDLVLLVLALVAIIGWAASVLWFQPGYGTDEAAFEHYAANLLLHGTDPYGADLSSSLNLYRVPIQYATYTMDGGMVHTLGYPAFPVLVVAAFIPLTHGIQSVVIANIAVMCLATIVGFVLLPTRMRPLAILMNVGLPILFGYAMGGVNAIIMMALLMVVATGWTSIGNTGRLSKFDVVRAICFGLAVSTQQLAWFIGPFLVLGIYLSRRGSLPRARALRLVAGWVTIGAAAFAVVNLPFLLWNAGTWIGGVADPITQHAIPYGQGLVDLTEFFGIGGGNLGLLTYGGGAVLLGLLTIYAMLFRTVGRAAFILPSLALFFPARSLAEYFMTVIAVWVMSVATLDRNDLRSAAQWDAPVRLARRGGRVGVGLLVAVCLLPAAGLLGMSFATPAPLTLKIDGMKTTGQMHTIWQVTVTATNHSQNPLRPHFAANFMGQATTYWNILDGPVSLAPRASATYVLAAPNNGSMPGLTQSFLMQAFTAKPQTISSSALFTAEPYSANITPGYVNQVLHPHEGVTLQVQLRSPFGTLVHKAGVKIALGQLIYDQTRLVPAQAAINGGAEGQTPVHALTDANGVATFHIVDDQPQDRPISFQAWIEGFDGYPFGYSDIIPVFWTSADR